MFYEQGLRLLIVEGNRADAEAQRQRLEQEGYSVIITTDPIFAERMIESGPIAAMAVAHQLSGDRNGLDLFLELRSRSIAPPTILLGDAADDGLILEALRGGIHDFVTKSSGYLNELVGAMRNVCGSDEREAHFSLRQQALNEVSEGIFFTAPTEPTNPLIYVNPAFGHLTGYSAVDIVGKSLHLLFGPETDPQAIADLNRAIASRRTYRGELLGYRPSGETFWALLSIAPLPARGGGSVHFVGVLSDVTQRRDLESQIRHSQRIEAVGRLAGGVAHDFNNILTIILGNAEMALDAIGADESFLKTSFEEIADAAGKAAMLTKQLLAFSRKQVLETIPLDVNSQLRSLERMLARLIGENVSLLLNLDAQLGVVKADPGQIEQVIMNLAVNARDAMPNGGSLSIQTSNIQITSGDDPKHGHFRPGSYVVLSVSDTGCGISPSVIDHIFEPFFTTKRSSEGIGLGLSTVHGIVTQSGGQILVNSKPGEGATFDVYFPRVDEVATPWRQCTPRGQLVQETGHILLVEDETPVRRLAQRILTDAGYRVLEAGSGEEALCVARHFSEHFDLLITDVVLPGMNGRQLAQEMRALHPALKALYVSGYSGNVFGTDTSEQAAAFLPKPFSPNSLREKVRDLIETKMPLALAGPPAADGQASQMPQRLAAVADA